MNIILMDPWYNKEHVLDVFESLIWTERYIGYGNFELYTPMNQNMESIVDFIREKYGYQYQNNDCFALLQETGTAMFVEELNITTDVEIGNHLIISGRGLETILERRIIYKKITLSGNIQDCLEKLLNDSIISPEDHERKIENFIFERSDNPYLNELSIIIQCNIGDNLYDVVFNICEAYQIGFDITINSDNIFVFKLTYGEDRSILQYENPIVIFSTKYENIINSEYLESGKTYKNANLVVGDDRYGLNNVLTITNSWHSGLGRREIYTDASDIDFEDQYKKIEDDKEVLENHKQNLSSYQDSLSNVQKEKGEKTAEHNQKVAGFNQKKTGYQNRITVLNKRITYYENLNKQYKSLLDSGQKTAYNNREKYKAEVKKYDDLIKQCDESTNECNDKLQNDLTLTYEDIENCESTIQTNENEKEDYQAKKTEWENKQKAEEEKLPNFEEELKKYEDMISKYKGIIANDQKSLNDINNESSKELSEYNKEMGEYNNSITSYTNAISNTNAAISDIEEKIYWDTYDLNDEFNKLLTEKGYDELSENVYTRAFTSEIDASKTFVYGKDFFIGDIVEVLNEYGLNDQVRVSEIVRVEDGDGFKMYPTFKIIEYKEE